MYNRGRMEPGVYAHVVNVCNDPAKLAMWNKAIAEARLNPWEFPATRLTGDWKDIVNGIWDWFVANWPTILSILLKVLPLLMLEPQDEDS
jgi:hypothetical protein